MTPWHAHPVPALRHEALYGDRLVRCFADRPAGLHAMFERARAARGGSEAVVHEGRRWTYAEAGAQADHLAAGFAATGIGAGERVLMLLSNRPEFCFVLLALQQLGAIAVPVGIREQRPGLAFIAAHCSAVGIVFDDALADRVPLADEAATLRLALRSARSNLRARSLFVTVADERTVALQPFVAEAPAQPQMDRMVDIGVVDVLEHAHLQLAALAQHL